MYLTTFFLHILVKFSNYEANVSSILIIYNFLTTWTTTEAIFKKGGDGVRGT